jgi:hypothetical protein
VRAGFAGFAPLGLPRFSPSASPPLPHHPFSLSLK